MDKLNKKNKQTEDTVTSTNLKKNPTRTPEVKQRDKNVNQTFAPIKCCTFTKFPLNLEKSMLPAYSKRDKSTRGLMTVCST